MLKLRMRGSFLKHALQTESEGWRRGRKRESERGATERERQKKGYILYIYTLNTAVSIGKKYESNLTLKTLLSSDLCWVAYIKTQG